MQIGTLNNDVLNVMGLNCGRLPQEKAQEYIHKVKKMVEEKYKEYKIVYLGERD